MNRSCELTLALATIFFASTASADWTPSGSNIYFTGGDVGIGTTSPTAVLEVDGGDALINGLTVGLGGGGASWCTAIGQSALSGNTTGQENTALGTGALQSNGSGNNNTAAGAHALYSNTGSDNSAFGQEALASNTSGNYGVAIGAGALLSNTTGASNVGIGFNALGSNSTGWGNIAIGNNALYGSTITYGNIAIGGSTLDNLDRTTDSTGYNTAVGYQTGLGITTGTNNTILGARVQGLPSSLSNNIIIADGAGNRRINVDSNGNVGIATTAPGVALDVNGAVRPGSSATVTTCGSGAANGEGSMRYNYTSHAMEYCNGTSWTAL